MKVHKVLSDSSLKGVLAFLTWEIPCGNSNQPWQRFGMLKGVSYIRIYLRPYAQKCRRRELPQVFKAEFLETITRRVHDGLG